MRSFRERRHGPDDCAIMIIKKGINASPGVAIGPALVLDTEEYRISRRKIDDSQITAQIRLLDAAVESSRHEVSELRIAAARKLGEQTADIFAFHEKFIADPKLRETVVRLIEAEKVSAAYAFSQIMAHWQQMFRNVQDPYLKERSRDLADMEKRVLRHILGRHREDITRLTEPVIIVAHDITPSQAISLDRDHILAFAINVGGQASHTAIIARMLGIPAVVALADFTTEITGGENLIVDGTHGIVIRDPDGPTLSRYQDRRREYQALEVELRTLRDKPAVTQDGHMVSLYANIEIPTEAHLAMDFGAEGIGLYRTELLFLASGRLPTEEQQYEDFRSAVESAGGKPVVIRTIDLGADKLMHAMGPQHDVNPALGLRSLRYCLTHLDMFKTHIRAILRASAHGDVHIMFPMITTLMELRQAKTVLADAMEDLEEDGIPYRRDIPLGMMIETPAAALLAHAFVPEVRFFSIGTNDLTQYTLAVDRGNERVAHLYHPHNPAILRLIRAIVEAARPHGVSVSVCGEMAGSPIYGQLLLGLGVDALSMAPKDILAIKRLVRLTTIERCRQVAARALDFDDDRQVFNYLREELTAVFPEDP